jgi:DNA-binding transcriptional ArsR family regulator
MDRSLGDDGIFQAIACPTRRRLIEALALGERNVSELVASLSVTQSAVSQQLGILKSAGLVYERAEGRFRYYQLCTGPLDQVNVWLNRYRATLERRLDALGDVLDTMPEEPAVPRAHPRGRRRQR